MSLRNSASAPVLGDMNISLPNNNDISSKPQQLLALADAAAATGDLEVAYLLYAKGSFASLQPPTSASGQDRSVRKCAAGQVQILAAMCQHPTAEAPSVPAIGVKQSRTTEAGISQAVLTQHVPAAPKHWQQMQDRLWSSCVSNSTSNTTTGSIMTTQQQHQQALDQQRLLQKQHQRFPASSSCPALAQLDTTTHTSSRCCGSSVSQAQHKGSTAAGGSSSSSSSSTSKCRRILCVSDLHVDRVGGSNMAWLKAISSSSFQNDVLIVAGDVADTAAAVSVALKLLSERFWRVVWVPGNHELWLRGDTRDRATYPDSWAKLMALRQMADAAGVDVGPVEVQPGLLLVPLLSWYNITFDIQDPSPGRYQHDSFCSWGSVPESEEWQVMLKLNSMTLQLVKQYKQYWQQQQQQQQQPEPTGPDSSSELSHPSAVMTVQLGQQLQQQQQAPGVAWTAAGFLAVSSSSGRRVPGLQLNLAKHTRRPVTPAPAPAVAPAAAAAAGAGAAAALGALAGAAAQVSPADMADSTVRKYTSNEGRVNSSSSSSGNSGSSSAKPDGSSAVGGSCADITVVTVSHFLPHPQLPHSRFSELSKAMGCQELQLQMQQVSSTVHVYGHSHRSADVQLQYTLPLTADKLQAAGVQGSTVLGTATDRSSTGPSATGSAVGGGSTMQQQQQGRCRYVQYAVDAVGAESAGLYCLWDGQQMCMPGVVLPTC